MYSVIFSASFTELVNSRALLTANLSSTTPAFTINVTVTAAVVSAASTVSCAFSGYSRAQSLQITLHGSPSAFNGGGVGGSVWRESVLCEKRNR